MDLAADIFNYSLALILVAVCGAWIFLIKSMTGLVQADTVP